MPYIYGGCIGTSIWMGSGLGCGMAAMDNVESCFGVFSILFLQSWGSYSYSALSLRVCYGAGMCMDLSVDLLTYILTRNVLRIN
jgi:hypothetical protein